MDIVTYSWVFGSLLQIVWAVRLWRQGLLKSYPVLFGYLILTSAYSLVGMTVYLVFGDAVAYGWIWALAQPFAWAASLSVVIEIYKRMLGEYKGLQRLGELAMYGALGTAFVIFRAGRLRSGLEHRHLERLLDDPGAKRL